MEIEDKPMSQANSGTGRISRQSPSESQRILLLDPEVVLDPSTFAFHILLLHKQYELRVPLFALFHAMGFAGRDALSILMAPAGYLKKFDRILRFPLKGKDVDENLLIALGLLRVTGKFGLVGGVVAQYVERKFLSSSVPDYRFKQLSRLVLDYEVANDHVQDIGTFPVVVNNHEEIWTRGGGWPMLKNDNEGQLIHEAAVRMTCQTRGVSRRRLTNIIDSYWLAATIGLYDVATPKERKLLSIYNDYATYVSLFCELVPSIRNGYSLSSSNIALRDVINSELREAGLVDIPQEETPLVPIIEKISFDPKQFTIGDILEILDSDKLFKKVGNVDIIQEEIRRAEEMGGFASKLILYILGLIPGVDKLTAILNGIGLAKEADKLLRKGVDEGESVLYYFPEKWKLK